MDIGGALRVAAAQPVTVTGDVAGNVAAHADAVRRCAATLVVFPEMSLTGYEMDAPVVDPGDPVLAPLSLACADMGTTALVGAPVRFGAGSGIGVLAVDGDGAEVVYVKMFLGPVEAVHFVPGAAPAVLEIGGRRIGIGVCKDTRIAEHIEATVAQGVDIYVAGMVHAPDELDEFESRAQDIANLADVPVVFAGFAGATGGGYPETSGGSGIWDGRGRRIAQTGSTPGEFVVADLARDVRPAAAPTPPPSRRR